MLLEIAAGSVEDCVVAQTGGADRVELNSALALGGLTPSLGTLLEVKQRTRLPVMAMVRPRPGGFCYSDAEFATMLRDADLLLEHGADGLVFGVLHADGRVDAARTAQLVARCGPRAAVFHRAFDVTPDPADALATLIDVGVARVLTSGQAPRALEGADVIRALVTQAAGRIEILPGAGIRPDSVAALLDATGCTQVHASLSAWQHDPTGNLRPAINFNATDLRADGFAATDPAAVSRMRAILDQRKDRVAS
ncbi:MAG: copper homeostasis protein CutC [Caldilineaceae bacterium]|nr:copper homeostasis protein CutC [Caldilineaceae bacterium]